MGTIMLTVKVMCVCRWLICTALLSSAPAFSADIASEDSADRFGDRVSLSSVDSIPSWPAPAKAVEGAPNIVVILLDDIGFADTGTFGGLARTPRLDELAANGLRYTQFHTTAICSSTRAALLSGRNHHRMGFGTVAEVGYPGYNAIWRKDSASVAEILRQSGYSTSAFGKWHNTPSWEIAEVGPFDRWPTGLGFEYFYGRVYPNGPARKDVNSWGALWRNNFLVSSSKRSDPSYRFTADIVDEAIRWLGRHHALATGRPYFLYLAPDAVHFPHQVPSKWIRSYRSRFDGGWNALRGEILARQKDLGVVPKDTVLTPWPREIPTWDSLPREAQALYARQMEVYSAYISETDYEIGRLLDAVRGGPDGNNTLIMYVVGDNGPEGLFGPSGTSNIAAAYAGQRQDFREELKYIDRLGAADVFNSYSSGWAWAGSTPFSGVKYMASRLGGIRNPLVISWPAAIHYNGEVRTQFIHANDVTPTVLDAAGVAIPSIVNGTVQQSMDGVSFLHSFNDAGSRSRHFVQYFEQGGSRGIYFDGWFAGADNGLPWERLWQGQHLSTGPRDTREILEARQWALYNLDSDFSQSVDLSRQYPDKLRRLQEMFETEAQRNSVYPLDVGHVGSGPPRSYLRR